MLQIKCDYSIHCKPMPVKDAEGWFEIEVTPMCSETRRSVLNVKVLKKGEPIKRAAMHACNAYHAKQIIELRAGCFVDCPVLEQTGPATT